MCILLEHFFSCTCPVPTLLPQPDNSPTQPDTDRQPCAKYILDVPCESQFVSVTLQARCPLCEALHQKHERTPARRATKVWDKVAEQVSTAQTVATDVPETEKQKRYGIVASKPRQGKVIEKKGAGYWAQDDEDEKR